MIGIFENKTSKKLRNLQRKKEIHRHFPDSWNVGDNEGKSARNYPRRDVGGRDVDSESWSIFQKFLLRDNESSSRNNIENDHMDRNMQ